MNLAALFSSKYGQYKCPKCSVDDETEKWMFDLRKGAASTYREYMRNKISTAQYTVLTFLPKCLFFSFWRLGNIYFLIISIIMLANSKLSPFSNWILIIPLALYIFINLIKEGTIDFMRQLNDKKINNQITRRGIINLQKGEDQDLDENVRWEDIEVGNIIYLMKNEIVPADIILLDSNEIRDRQAICYIDQIYVDGQQQAVKKKASNLTQILNRQNPLKLKFKNYSSLLTGKVEYEVPNRDLNSFNGFLKLNKDPKIGNLTIENFIPRGSIIKTAGWIYGLVVYTGMESKVMLNSNYSKFKQSYIERFLQYLYGAAILLVLIISSISMVVLMAKTKDIQFILDNDPIASDGKRFFTYIILYSQIIPISLYGILDLVQLISMFFEQRKIIRDVNRSFVERQEMIQINNPNILSNLGHIDYIMFDKTGILTSGDYLIHSIITRQKFFSLDWEYLEPELIKRRKQMNQMQMSAFNSSSPQQQQIAEEEIKNADNINKGNQQAQSQNPLTNHNNDSQYNHQIQQPDSDPNRMEEQVSMELEGGGQVPWESARQEHFVNMTNRVNQFENHDNHEWFKRNKRYDSPMNGDPEQQRKPTLDEKVIIPNEDQEIIIFSHSSLVNNKLMMGNGFINGQIDLSLQDQLMKKVRTDKKKHTSTTMSHKTQEDDPKAHIVVAPGQLAGTNLQLPVRIDRKHSSVVIHPQKIEYESNEGFIANLNMILDMNSSGKNYGYKNDLQQLFLAMLLCHEATTIYKYVTDEYFFESKSNIEVALLNFAHLCGFTFDTEPSFDELRAFKTKIKGENKKWDVLGINAYSQKRRRNSVVIKDPQQANQGILYCKGDAQVMKNLLVLDSIEVENLEKHLSHIKKKGIRPIIFGSRCLGQEEVENYQLTYTRLKAHPMSQTEELEELSIDWEKKLRLLGIVCVREHLTPGAEQFVKTLMESGVNTWVLSGDDEESAVNIAHYLNIIDSKKYPQVYTIGEKDRESIFGKLKSILYEMKDIIAPQHQDFDQMHRKPVMTSPEIDSPAKNQVGESPFQKNLLQYVQDQGMGNSIPNGGGNPLSNSQQQKSLNQNQNAIVLQPINSSQQLPDVKQVPSQIHQTQTSQQQQQPQRVTIQSSVNIQTYYKQDTVKVTRKQSMTKSQKFQKRRTMKNSQKGIALGFQESNRQSVGRQTFMTKSVLAANQLCLLNFCLIVSGQSLEQIMQDTTLLQHFTFVSAFCKNIFGYGISPVQKSFIVNLVQKKFLGAPTVCAIGSGLKDAWMMQNADISIELALKKESKKQQQIGEYDILSNSGDVIVSSILMVRYLILVKGLQMFFNIRNMCFLIFHQSLLFGVTLFYFNWYTSFTGSSLYDSLLVFLFNILFNITPLVMIGVMDKPVNNTIMSLYPALYITGQQEKKEMFVRFILQISVEAILQGTFIFYSSIYATLESSSDQGDRSDLYMQQLLILYSVIAVFNLKTTIVLWANKIYSMFAIIPAVVVFIIIYMFVNDDRHYSRNNNLIQTTVCIFTWKALQFQFVCNVVASLLLSYGWFLLCNYTIMPNVYNRWARCNERKQLINNCVILDESNQKDFDIGEFTKRIFNKAQNIDKNIQDMLNPADANIVDMKINKWTLNINDKKLERLFKYDKVRDSLFLFRALFFIVLMLFGFFTLLESQIDSDHQTAIMSYISLGIFLGFLGLLLLIMTSSYQRYYYSFTSNIFFLFITAKFFFDWMYDGYMFNLTSALVSLISTFNYNMGLLKTVLLNTICIIEHIIRVNFTYYYSDINLNDVDENEMQIAEFYAVASYIILIISITAINIFFLYKSEKLTRKDFIAKEGIKLNRSETDDILSILVPQFVQNKINNMEFAMAEDQEDVAILFSDIYDFDNIINTEKKRIVYHLDQLFRTFDQLCLHYGVQKIETVGKTYMAAAGIKECEAGLSEKLKKQDKEQRLIKMAYEMLRVAQSTQYGLPNERKNFVLKIGIHRGPVIAGIIGYHKPQFSLIGDSVNTTSRVCSKCHEGHITISKPIYDRVCNNSWYFVKDMIQPKGLKEMPVWRIFEHPPKIQEKVQQRFVSLVERMKEQKLIKLQKRPSLSTLLANQSLNKEERMKNVLTALGLKIDKPKPMLKPDGSGSDIQQIRQNSGLDLQTSVHVNGEAVADPTLTNNNNNNVNVIGDNDNKDLMVQQFQEDYDDFNYEDETEDDQLLQWNMMLQVEYNSQPYKNCLQMLRDQCAHDAQIVCMTLIVAYLLQTMIQISVREQFMSGNLLIFLLRGIFLMGLILSLLILKRCYVDNKMKSLLFLIYLYGLLPSYFQCYFTSVNDYHAIQLLEITLILLTFSSYSLYSFTQITVLTLINLALFFIVFGLMENLDQDYIFFMLIYNVFNEAKNFRMIKQYYQFFNDMQTIDSKKRQHEGLISQLLPIHALQKLKNSNSLENKLELTDEFENVTILFADISGFTEYSNQVKSPQTVVVMLRKLFEDFDKQCLKYKVFKLYTIGDCYVVMGFTNAAKRSEDTYVTEAKNVVKMGLAMIEVIQNVRKEFKQLNMRIGIHTGSIIGGIIGTDIVRYDIYGRDVLIANKMESNGKAGNVMVSEATKTMLQRDKVNCPYQFEFFSKVDISNFNISINGYLINAKSENNNNNN